MESLVSPERREVVGVSPDSFSFVSLTTSFPSPFSGFSKVRFLGVSETTLTDTPLECRFVIRSAKQPHPSDCIGLFRVGWSSVEDSVCSRAIPTAGGGVLGNGEGETVYSVTFNADDLPHNDGEFYQFCYVSTRGALTPSLDGGHEASGDPELPAGSPSGSHILGASAPFQFIDDDFEILDQPCPDSSTQLAMGSGQAELSQLDADGSSMVDLGHGGDEKGEGDGNFDVESASSLQDQESTASVKEQGSSGTSAVELEALRMELSELKQSYALSLISLKDSQATEAELRSRLAEVEKGRLEDAVRYTEQANQLTATLEQKSNELASLVQSLDSMRLMMSEMPALHASMHALEASKGALVERVAGLEQEASDQASLLSAANQELALLKAAMSDKERVTQNSEKKPSDWTATQSCSEGAGSSVETPRSDSSEVRTGVVAASPFQSWFGNPYEDYVPESQKRMYNNNHIYNELNPFL